MKRSREQANPAMRTVSRVAGLMDIEVITIGIFGEMTGHHYDASIWRYTDVHFNRAGKDDASCRLNNFV